MHVFFQYFKEFIEQEIEKFEDRRNAEDGYDEENVQKPFREVSRPLVIKIDDKFYFVSGKDQVFFLNISNLIQALVNQSTPNMEIQHKDTIYSRMMLWSIYT